MDRSPSLTPAVDESQEAPLAVRYAAGLRALAQWIEAHPDIELPSGSIDVFGVEETKENAARIIRALGRCEKDYTSADLFTIRRNFGPVVYRFAFYRSTVCEKKVVGYRDVPEQLIPAHTQEIVEWECHPVLSESEAA